MHRPLTVIAEPPRPAVTPAATGIGPALSSRSTPVEPDRVSPTEGTAGSLLRVRNLGFGLDLDSLALATSVFPAYAGISLMGGTGLEPVTPADDPERPGATSTPKRRGFAGDFHVEAATGSDPERLRLTARTRRDLDSIWTRP